MAGTLTPRWAASAGRVGNGRRSRYARITNASTLAVASGGRCICSRLLIHALKASATPSGTAGPQGGPGSSGGSEGDGNGAVLNAVADILSTGLDAPQVGAVPVPKIKTAVLDGAGVGQHELDDAAADRLDELGRAVEQAGADDHAAALPGHVGLAAAGKDRDDVVDVEGAAQLPAAVVEVGGHEVHEDQRQARRGVDATHAQPVTGQVGPVVAAGGLHRRLGAYRARGLEVVRLDAGLARPVVGEEPCVLAAHGATAVAAHLTDVDDRPEHEGMPDALGAKLAVELVDVFEPRVEAAQHGGGDDGKSKAALGVGEEL